MRHELLTGGDGHKEGGDDGLKQVEVLATLSVELVSPVHHAPRCRTDLQRPTGVEEGDGDHRELDGHHKTENMECDFEKWPFLLLEETVCARRENEGVPGSDGQGADHQVLWWGGQFGGLMGLVSPLRTLCAESLGGKRSEGGSSAEMSTPSMVGAVENEREGRAVFVPRRGAGGEGRWADRNTDWSRIAPVPAVLQYNIGPLLFRLPPHAPSCFMMAWSLILRVL